ncbi:2'-5' RNA ligase family protein [Nocardia sp. XZ_19_385]|uniref:2'-5' RNA ligase family protein n=1 Tax=Nocardia sp. XZ_19_385 TaxID=2769488 RepID=UPI002815B13A|nr:2'-5' RNA ligase family protein [Nocardia sp. XZ_19_385]
MSELIRRTAILIAVPELADFTDRWRSVSYWSECPGVPLTEIVPPHISVLVPWLAEPSARDVQRLRDAIADVDPFEIIFPAAGRFPNGTVWLRPEPFDRVRELLRSVFAAFPECPPYGGEFTEPHPHLTIAMPGQHSAGVLAEAEAALAVAPPPVFRFDALGLWREHIGGAWQPIGSVPLDNGRA